MPPLRGKRLFLLGLAGVALGLSPGARARMTEVTVVVDMTPEGRKLLHPDPAHPAYYLPLLFGFTQDGGAFSRGETPPDPADVARRVGLSLSHQGYVVAHPGLKFNARQEVVYADDTVLTVPPYPVPDRPLIFDRPRDFPLTADMLHAAHGHYSLALPADAGARAPAPLVQVLRHVNPVHGAVVQGLPSLVLVILLGDMHPNEVRGAAGAVPVRLNGASLVALMAGNTFDSLSIWDQEEIQRRTGIDRFFLILHAYDLPTLLHTKKTVLLWSAKMSVPSNTDTPYAQFLPVMLAAGESHFGRESTHPEVTPVEMSAGRVIIGTPRVKDDAPAQAP